MALLFGPTLALDTYESRATETTALALFSTVLAGNRTRFSTTTSTLGEKLVVAVALLASFVFYAASMNSGISESAEATLFTFLITGSAREWA